MRREGDGERRGEGSVEVKDNGGVKVKVAVEVNGGVKVKVNVKDNGGVKVNGGEGGRR